MLHRTMLAAVGLVAVLFLGGCVFKSEGRRDGYTRTHHTRVYNVQQRSYPHSHDGGTMHAHVGGNQRHDHGTAVDHHPGNSGKHKGHHKRCDHRGCGDVCHVLRDPGSPEASEDYPPQTRHPHDDNDDDNANDGDHDDDDHGHGKGHGKGHDKGKGKGHDKGKGKGHDKD